ncbi:MAG: hypothetical protein AAB545_01910 [Patescibacteria group bacterium]
MPPEQIKLEQQVQPFSKRFITLTGLFLIVAIGAHLFLRLGNQSKPTGEVVFS